MDGFGFWIAAGLMAFLVGAYMLRALRADDTAIEDTGDPQISLYRDQLAEVDRDVARGVLAQPEAERLRTEVQRRILDAARAQPISAPRRVSQSHATIASGAIFAALVGGVGLYLSYGAPGYPDLPLTVRIAQSDAAYASRPSQDEAEAAAEPRAPAQIDPQFATLLEQLRSAVAARPNDIQGLTLLARNEAQIGNYAAARRAYGALIAAKGADASGEDYLGYAQTMISAANGIVTPQAEAALMEVLQRDPENGPARYLSGLMFAQVGRPDRTFDLWAALLEDSPQGAPWVASLRELLPQVANDAGVQYQLPAEFGPSAEDIANAAEMSPEDRQLMITSMVEGLEARLMAGGETGSGEEWARLVSSLIVLGEGARAEAAFEAARLALAADPTQMQLVLDAAQNGGIAP
jgi:cytochrome c-type biogenesis protein CcmH